MTVNYTIRQGAALPADHCGVSIASRSFYFLQDAQPASYPMGERCSPSEVKRPGREADLSPLYGIWVNNDTYLSGRIEILQHACAWIPPRFLNQ